MKKNLALLALGATLLAGCAGPLVGATGTGEASLSVVASVKDGQFRTQTPGFSPYTKSSINHLVLKLYTVDGGSESLVVRGGSEVKADVTAALLDNPVTFKGLHHDTTYRIKAFAYKATGEATDDLISTQDDSSYRDVSVGRSLSPSVVSLPVKLIDRLFKAEGTSSIVVTDGSLIHEDETLSLVQALGIVIAGTYNNFTVNGETNPDHQYIFYYRPAVSGATASVPITNNGSEHFYIWDRNGQESYWLAPGATASMTATAVNGALDISVDAGP